MKYVFTCTLIVLFFGYANSGVCDVSEESTQELQFKLNSIEHELKSRGATLKKKQERIKKAESQFTKIINKNSWRNAVMGSVLAAAVTAHPAGLLVGGIAGSLVGKSKKYDKAEEQLAAIEYEIIVDEDNFLTEGEVRLANFAGEEIDRDLLDDETKIREQMLAVAPDNISHEAGGGADFPEEDITAMDDVDFDRPSASPAATTRPEVMPMINVAGAKAAQANNITQSVAGQQNGGRMELESCYGRNAETAAQKRKRLPHCFYMMY